MAFEQNREMAFYNAILQDGANMQKTASEQDILAALENSDLSEEELNKLASDLEDALNDLDDIDEVDETEETDETEVEDTEVEETEVDEVETEVDETEETEVEETEVEETEVEEAETEDAEEEEVEGDDIESLAAAYEAEYEKYASEGLTVRDYVYNQVEDAEFAAVVGDMAEKLAYVSELPVFMVADDLMTTISAKISATDNEED